MILKTKFCIDIRLIRILVQPRTQGLDPCSPVLVVWSQYSNWSENKVITYQDVLRHLRDYWWL